MVIYIAYDIKTCLKLRCFFRARSVMILATAFSLRVHSSRNQRLRLTQQIQKNGTVASASAAALASTDEEIFNNRLSLIRNLADMQLAIYFCFPNSTWPSHWVGLFGVINALTGGNCLFPHFGQGSPS